LGLHVDLFSDHEHPYQKYAGDLPGKAIQRYLESRGVTFHPNAPVSALQGDGRAQRVLTPDGQSHPCDLVLVAIGVVPHKELLRGTPIAAERAILTDEFCRTNVPDVFAAGDCAARFDPLFSKHRATDHWDASLSSGRIAGAAMTGTLIPSTTVSSFSTRVFDLTLQSFGEPRLAARRLTRTTPNTDLPTFTEFGTDSLGRLTQILTSDPSLDPEFLRNLLTNRPHITGHEESLKDPSIPLSQLFPS
jgi:NADPH-dependent 2,4-dienoyl-CoA reductase/sulfur reductase-like enzyme